MYSILGPQESPQMLLSAAHNPTDDEMSLFRRRRREHVEANRMVNIRGFKIDQVVRPPRRIDIEKFIAEIPMRIDQHKALSGTKVANNHLFQKGGLPRTRLPDHDQMLPTVGSRNPKRHFPAIDLPYSKLYEVILHYAEHQSSCPGKSSFHIPS